MPCYKIRPAKTLHVIQAVCVLRIPKYIHVNEILSTPKFLLVNNTSFNVWIR